MQIPPGSARPSIRAANVDPIAEDIAALQHDVADIDADAKPHATIFGKGLVGLSNITLNGDRAFYGGKNAAELGEYAVAGCAADPASMQPDERVGDGTMGRKCRQRLFLIEAHEGAIALNIGRNDCIKFSLEGRRLH
jgi:hypothetical protein